MTKKKLMFDRRTHNTIVRGIEAIERLADELERYNDENEGIDYSELPESPSLPDEDE